MEVWLPIEDYPWYEVSSQGRVRSINRIVPERSGARKFHYGKILNPWTESGYKTVDLSKEGVKKSFAVHIIVCTTFHGKCSEGLECRHLDGDQQNNLPDNLMWGTRKENVHDAIRHGTMPFLCGRGGGKIENLSKPETLAKLRPAALNRWSDPEERRKQSERIKESWNRRR